MKEASSLSNNIYWTYRIDDIFWSQLLENFKKKQFRLSSFKPNCVRKGDIILIFKTNKTITKTGFISVCQVETDFIYNENNIKIFSDKNMNKYYCELSSIFVLHKVLRLSEIKTHLSDFSPISFRKTNIGNNYHNGNTNPDFVITGYSISGDAVISIPPFQFENFRLYQAPGSFNVFQNSIGIGLIDTYRGHRYIDFGNYLILPRIEMDMKSNQMTTARISFNTFVRRTY
jgi:hypothetical protein